MEINYKLNNTIKKMKKVLVAIVAVSTLLVSCKEGKKDKVNTGEEISVEKKEMPNNVDAEQSVLNWKGAKPTGTHNGTVKLEKGSLLVENNKLVGGEFVVDMTSIKNEDLDEKGAAKLEGHLKSADFFDVEKYPASKFVIVSVKENEGKLAVTGNLTIKDVTKSITIPAMLTKDGGVVTFTSETFTIDRADFNVKYGSKKWFDNLKDKFINDLVEMSFTVKTKA